MVPPAMWILCLNVRLLQDVTLQYVPSGGLVAISVGNDITS